MNVVFAGTPAFAVPCLEALLGVSDITIDAVYTQPDRPAGRGRKMRASPVKASALEHELIVHQPQTLRSEAEAERLAAFAPALMVVVAYGLILPQKILQIPTLGCVNVHASLLPRWRGAAPIQRAILAGDTQTGVSIMKMEVGLDTGPVYLSSACDILPTDTAASLHDRLAALGPCALISVIENLRRGAAHSKPQDDGRANYAERIDKAEAQIDWRKDAGDIERLVRAFHPVPVAFSYLKSTDDDANPTQTRVKIWAVEASAEHTDAPPGEILSARPAGIEVATGSGRIKITTLQAPGARAMDARAFLNAKPIAAGAKFCALPT